MVFNLPKSIQASVTLLENIHVILEKTPSEDVSTDILPIIYSGLESSTVQVQVRREGAGGEGLKMKGRQQVSLI